MFFIWIFPFKPPFVDDLSITGWWFGTFTIFPFSWEYIIIPTDEFHHFSEGFQPPTSYIIINHH